MIQVRHSKRAPDSSIVRLHFAFANERRLCRGKGVTEFRTPCRTALAVAARPLGLLRHSLAAEPPGRTGCTRSNTMGIA
jgi:hypothetical protein